MGVGTYWRDNGTQGLREAIDAGLTGSQIAARLGHNLTRNAIAGQVHKLGLSLRDRSQSQAGIPATKRTFPPPVARRPAGLPPAHPIFVALRELARVEPSEARWRATPKVSLYASLPMEESTTPRVSIMQLGEAVCRWPLGDPRAPDFGYCGAKAPVGAPYCAWHHRLAHEAPAARRGVKPGGKA